MKTAKYLINGIGFTSIKSVQDHCRKIKQTVTKGIDPRPDMFFLLSGDDADFVVDMVTQLVGSDSIIGIGLSAIKVGYVPPEIGLPHWGFYAVRVDRTESLFGFGKFGKTAEQVRSDRINRAKRIAIADQIIAYKENYFCFLDNAICEATGDVMKKNECHVDHNDPWPFQRIQNEFFKEESFDVFDDGLNWNISDPKLKKDWQDFHKSKAILRCVTSNFNLTRKESWQ